MTAKPPVPAEALAEEFGSIGPAADRLRLVGIDYAGRLQKGRIGATERRLALTEARRPADATTIAALETALATERRVAGAFVRATTRAEIEIPTRSPDAAVLHGLVIGADGAPSEKVTVAATREDGSVRRFTCTDGKGYFRMDLSQAGQPGETVFLQVSDAEQAVLYRGDEAIRLTPGAVAYREIRLTGDRLEPCPLPPDRATMPRLLDLPESEALAVLERLGLALGRRLTQSALGREGLVVSQEPPAGTPVTSETEVTLVIGVSSDGESVVVPDVTGLGEDEARARLQEAGLAIGRVTRQPASEAPGTVLRQSPPAGTRVPAGSEVGLVVAIERPDERVEVPELVGQLLEEARSILDQSGLMAGRVSFRDDDRVGQVIEQSPQAGTKVARDTPVSLVVGRRTTPDRVEVPRLTGRTLAGAREILAAAKLTLGEASGDRQGVVVRQKPEAGTSVPVGSAVSIELEGRESPPGPGGGVRDFSDVLVARMADDPGFRTLSIPRERMRDILVENGVGNVEAAGRLVAMDNAQLRDAFGLDNLNQARTLRRMLREAAGGLS